MPDAAWRQFAAMHASASASAAGDQAWPQASSALGAATRSAVVAATVRELDWLLVEHGAVAAHRGGAAAHALAAGDYVRPQALCRTWALVRRPLAVAVRSAGASMVAFFARTRTFSAQTQGWIDSISLRRALQRAWAPETAVAAWPSQVAVWLSQRSSCHWSTRGWAVPGRPDRGYSKTDSDGA